MDQKASEFLLSLCRPVPVMAISTAESNLSVPPAKKTPTMYHARYVCMKSWILDLYNTIRYI
jgi:hypothetical protein